MNRREGINQEAWEKAYETLSGTSTAQDIEGLDFVIVQEAIARAIQSSVEAERAKIADFCEAQAPTVVGKLFSDLIRKGA